MEQLFTIIRIKVIQLQSSVNYKGGKDSPKYALFGCDDTNSTAFCIL